MSQTRRFSLGSKALLRARTCGVLSIALLSGVLSSNAHACLNDREMQRGEAQFRSRYEAPSPDMSTIVNHQETSRYGWIALGTGAGLTAGSLVVVLGRRKHKAK